MGSKAITSKDISDITHRPARSMPQAASCDLKGLESGSRVGPKVEPSVALYGASGMLSFASRC